MFAFGLFGTQHGNNAVTVVTYEETGNFNIQRFHGLFTETIVGAGLGDLNFDGVFDVNDVGNVAGAFEEVLYSEDAIFNSAADTNADGLINAYDLLDLEDIYIAGGADAQTLSLWNDVKHRRADFDFDGSLADLDDLAILEAQFGSTDWRFDLDANGIVDQADSDFFVDNWLVTSVPEPSSALLLGLMSLGFAGSRRRKL